MRIKRTLQAILLGLCAVAGQSQADETLWAAGVTQESGWNDTNKASVADSEFCWGIAAANLLAWWQEQHRAEVPPGTPTGKEVWQVIRQSFSNVGSDPDQAIRWWFSGQYEPAQPESCARITDPQTGAYYKEYEIVRGGEVASRLLYYGRRDTVNAHNLTQALHSGFRRGDAFWIGVCYLRANGQYYYHSLNLWGIDCRTQADGTPSITAIYMTDSDDRQQLLHRIPVREDGGMLIFDCADHPLYGRIGRIAIDTFTGMRLTPQPVGEPHSPSSAE